MPAACDARACGGSPHSVHGWHAPIWQPTYAQRSDQLTDLLDLGQPVAGQDALFAACQRLASVTSRDLTLGAHNCCSLSAMRGRGLRSHWRWLIGCIRMRRATGLVALNNGSHPLFMPARGKALAA